MKLLLSLRVSRPKNNSKDWMCLLVCRKLELRVEGMSFTFGNAEKPRLAKTSGHGDVEVVDFHVPCSTFRIRASTTLRYMAPSGSPLRHEAA